MKTSLLVASVSAGSMFVLIGAPNASGADVKLQKVPPLAVEQAPAYPENLARYHLGAQVQAAPQSRPIANLQLSTNSDDRNAAEAALLCGDPTVGYALPAGETTILVSLPKIENVGRIAFLNNGATGDVTVATSSAKLPANSPQWHRVVQQPLTSSGLQATLGPSDAKYIRVTFNVSEAGRIAGFGVYSSGQISDFTAPRARKLPLQDKSDSFALISYSLADIHAKGRALYVSSGSEPRQANNMIDDQTATTYNFAAEDNTPTAVFDLGKQSTVRRLAAIYSPRAGKMDFYVLPSLPGDATSYAPENIQLNDEIFASLKSVGSVTDDGTRGRASIDFPATTGRYVMMRWTPSVQDNAAFAVAEVAAFGAGKVNTLLAANDNASASRAYEEDNKNVRDGKTMIEAKDMPGEGPEEAPQSPAEGPPPSLPLPPPFTFVPVLTPNSP